MKNILKINSKLFLLFVLLLGSITIKAQNGESGEDPFDFNGMNDLNNVDVYASAGDSNDNYASEFWYLDYNISTNDNQDYYNNDNPSNPNNPSDSSSSGNSPSDENHQGQNIIDKPVITSAELAKLIADLVSRYKVTSKYNYILTTSDGKTHIGTITRLNDSSTGHSLYYFMPYNTDSIFKEGLQYKIPEPGNNGSSANPNATGVTDSKGMPVGFYIMATNIGNTNVYFAENHTYLEDDYCEGCTKIENGDNPKFPKLAKVLKKIMPFVLNNQTMLKNIMLLTGYNQEQVQFLLWEGNLQSRMRVADIANWGLYEAWVTPDVFFVKANLVTSLETGGYKLGGNNLGVGDTSFFIAMVIVHELIHYARHVNNLPQKVGIYEAGEVFETNVFGKVLGSSNITNLGKQYGWYF